MPGTVWGLGASRTANGIGALSGTLSGTLRVKMSYTLSGVLSGTLSGTVCASRVEGAAAGGTARRDPSAPSYGLFGYSVEQVRLAHPVPPPTCICPHQRLCSPSARALAAASAVGCSRHGHLCGVLTLNLAKP